MSVNAKYGFGVTPEDLRGELKVLLSTLRLPLDTSVEDLRGELKDSSMSLI